ncbi:MAG: hypothetical protein PHQ80_03405 [Candidatus ainarchaeum sp.]|nr:hypothetical protein [Candidatus ainarchaeum sp.]MDD5096539.1 hypothetical protein [Candidatus ainarchaeum sp.]
MSRKGFFFVLISFVLLSYILVSTTMWVRAIEASELTYSDAFRASTLNTLTDQVSQERMDRYADIVSHYSLHQLSNHSVRHELRAGESADQFSHIRSAYLSLIANCTSLPEDYEDGVPFAYAGEDSRTYCFRGFLNQLNNSMAAQGFEVQSFELYNLSFNETGHPLRFAFNATLHLSVKDLQTDTAIERTYEFNRIVDAEGMVDPLVARESLDLEGKGARENLTIYKGVYLYPPVAEISGYGEMSPDELHGLYADAHEELYPRGIGSGSEGQGWFYGPVVFAEDAKDVSSVAAPHTILAGNYTDIKFADNWENFGAYILLDEPDDPTGCSDQSNTLNPIQRETGTHGCDESIDESNSDYTNKPFMVYADFEGDVYDEMLGRYRYHEPGQPPQSVRILFIAQYSAEDVLNEPDDKLDSVAVFDMENLRDFARCSYYIVNPAAPSFLQRMFRDGYKYSSANGIETFLIGKYAGGIYNPELDGLSRVDGDFFTGISGERIRGMPGCKDPQMCVNPNSDLGHFALSDGAMEYYLGVTDSDDEGNIGCNDGRAACEE